MKTSNDFEAVIKQHLDKTAIEDTLFAKTYSKKNKNIKECCQYILSQVKKSGCNGFSDAEIFGMAIHYYDEDNIKVDSNINAKVVTNHSVEITEQDRTEAKQKALEQLVEEEKQKLTAKKQKQKEQKEVTTQQSLF